MSLCALKHWHAIEIWDIKVLFFFSSYSISQMTMTSQRALKKTDFKSERSITIIINGTSIITFSIVGVVFIIRKAILRDEFVDAWKRKKEILWKQLTAILRLHSLKCETVSRFFLSSLFCRIFFLIF